MITLLSHCELMFFFNMCVESAKQTFGEQSGICLCSCNYDRLKEWQGIQGVVLHTFNPGALEAEVGL